MKPSTSPVRNRLPPAGKGMPARHLPADRVPDQHAFAQAYPTAAAFVDLHPLPASIVDPLGVIYYGNRPFQTCFADAGLPTVLGDAQHDPLPLTIARACATAQIQRCALAVADHPGHRTAMEVHCVPLQLELHPPLCICVFYLSEVTPSLPQQRLDDERALNEFKSRLYAMLVHDFRTPLFTIKSATSMLQLFLDKMEGSRRDSLLDMIKRGVDDLVEFVNDLEVINKARSTGLHLNVAPVDALDLCTQLIQDLQAYGNDSHTFMLSASPGLVQLQADKPLLTRALRNLLTNALKFSPPGSSIRLELFNAEREVLIRVSDQGMGIPETERERVFETFYRAKNVGAISGTGLGLALVKYAVLQQGGSIDIDSAEGVGTSITLHFPL